MSEALALGATEAGINAADGKNVGILAMEVYTPSTYVTQADLEQHSGVAAGRYTIGLGQDGLAICGDAEDVNSLALTVVHLLLEKYDIDPMQVGRLEVGTETLVDKSKSTKTVLMNLFAGNTDIEGATVVNACYGGTAALLNAMMWVESDGWDGRYAIVVAADIAAYARGPARPTCGAGAVAVLIGRDAPLCFYPKERATHAAHVWDFFKPDHTVEYPTVDGALSQVCYYQALEDVYSRFCDKMNAQQLSSQANGSNGSTPVAPFDAKTPDYFCFHAPYNKLVQKSFGRLFFLDARRRQESGDNKEAGDGLEGWVTKPIDETYADKGLEKALKVASDACYKEKLTDSNAVSKMVGNTYTASVFLGLASLVDRAGSRGELTTGKSIVMFSYGSGAIATMYRLTVRQPTKSAKFSIDNMVTAMNLTSRLESREKVDPSELDYALETRARMHRAGAPYSPVYPNIGRLFPGTYYLNGIDAKWRRTYSRVPLDAKMEQPDEGDATLTLAPPHVLRVAKREQMSHPVTGKLEVLIATEEGSADKSTEARRRMACVITGTAAGLPGNTDNVFDSKNMARLLNGETCITPISDSVKQAMLDKNVVQLKKFPDGTSKRLKVDTEAQAIKLAAQLGPFDLSALYGVPRGLAETMDVAAQIAVAAGMEALKDAGLVSGKTADPKDWLLPEQYRDSTGVVYASSFPAMDAAVGEVMKYLQSKTVGAASTQKLIAALRARMIGASPDGQISADDEAALTKLSASAESSSNGGDTSTKYEFDRKFLFRVLVLGNSQLAQLAGCRGPNTQTNAACAGTTQAIAMAQDMLISGRAQRVVVVAGDNASGETLLPWLGSGFRALGAATIEAAVEDAALPFDKRRSGMLLGAGGIGMVLETENSTMERKKLALHPFAVKARLLATQYSNSAFHGAALDRKHIGSELKRFLSEVEMIHGITKAEIAAHGVYFSHETCTHASDASSCAGNEVAALRMAFDDNLLSKLLILNTKGYTGHPMGVSFEDVTAVEVLMKQIVPPVPNYKEKDDYLGELNISKGGHYACRYALRFAAGFGSQVAFALYATAQYE